MKLYDPGFSSLLQEGKYTIITAPTGRGKTWETALLHLKRLAESQAQFDKTMSIETSEVTTGALAA